MKRQTVLLGLLVSASAHAVPSYCSLAGHYVGAYAGNTDRGTIEAIVSQTDGTVHGVAASHDGREIPFGGVVMQNGSFSAGSAATGSQFVGRFLTRSNGVVSARGDWMLGTSQAGQWQIERDAIAGDCQ